MAYDVELADRLREHLDGTPTTEKRMFGGLAFLVNGHMAIAAGSKGALMVRCDPADTDAHVSRGAARMVMRGKELDGWLHVDAESVVEDTALAGWVEVGVSRAESLPPK